ncbi:MAG: tetratricopeptide repeat protein [Kofleriaceae bacterium]|nr:tetratricopeptide repeat protein [Kofleriaceae bacterium]
MGQTVNSPAIWDQTSNWNTFAGSVVLVIGMATRYLLLALCIGACSSNSDTPSSNKGVEPAKPIVLTRHSGGLSDMLVTSYWKSADSRKAAELFAGQEYQAARDLFAATSAKTSDLSARRALMVSICDAKLGDHKAAAKGYEKALVIMPDLSNFLHFSAARSHFFAHQSAQSMSHARAVESASIHGADAALLIGDLLRAQNRPEATYKHYKHYLESRKSPIRSPEARFRMAQAASNMEKHLDAAKNLQQITIEAPLTRWASRASKLLGTTLKKLSESDKSTIKSLSAQQHITRAQVYYRKMRNEKSEASFAAALEAPELTEAMHCNASYHLANSVYKQRNRTKAAPLFLAALKSCEKSGNSDLYVKAAYQGGRSFATLGQREKAIELYSLIESKHPEHSYADDARVLRAEEYEKLGDSQKVDKLLASVPDKYPKGDMAAESLWRLAWRAYKAKNYKQAIKSLQKQVDLAAEGADLGAEGQALYWLARSQGKLGKTKAALLAYRQVIKDYPLSYYSLLALNRLRESHPDVFQEVKAEIASAPAGENDGSFQFRQREEYKSAGFARAIEFLRLGLSSPAAAELARLGFTAPKGRERLHDEDAIDRAWAVAYLQHSIGNFGRALWSTRWHVLGFKSH